MLALAPNLALFALIVASSFIINQVFDVESDRLNEKNFLLGSGLVSRGEAVALCAAVSAGAAAIALGSAEPVREIGLVGLALGFAYSVPPLRLKARPAADMLANGLGFGLVGFALGWLALLPYSADMLVRAAPYALAMCSIFLNTTIPDEPGDRSAGDRTTCVALGPGLVARAALAMLAASAAVAFLAGEAPCAIAAVASLPAFIAVAVEPSARVSVLASQFAARAFFVVLSVRVPQLGLLGALAYGLSKIYYARRLGLDYPRIEGASARVRMSPRREEGCRSKSLRSGP
jgi:chlorophyll synthase